MKSLKSKLILGITLLIFIPLLIVICISLVKSSDTTEQVANYQYRESIKASTGLLEMNFYQVYNTVNTKDGNLVDTKGNTINLNNYLDKFSEKMGVKNTVFVKNGDDYVRIASTIDKELIGTTLDSSSDEYKAITNGNDYYGYVKINGKEYLSGYSPIYSTSNGSGEILGVISTEVPTSQINAMIDSNQKKTMQLLTITSAIIFVIIVAIIYYFSSILTKPIKEVSYMAKEFRLGHFNYRIKNKAKDEVGQMANDMNALADDLQILTLGIKKISQGEVDIHLTPKDDKDELTPALMEMVNSIDELLDETKKISIEVENGNLSARGDTTRFKGEFIHIVNTINGTLDSVVKPMQEVIHVMQSLCTGNLKANISNEYKGDYANLTNAVNQMVRVLNVVLNEIATIITRIADADLNITDIRNYDGDFKMVTVAFNKIVDNLNSTMKEIHAASVQVAAGSGQIADTSVLLSQGSEQQASSIEEVTSAITQMAAQVQENAQNANQADNLSKSAKDSAVKGDEQMQKMLESMHEINESSNNISKIIKVIDDIAFQTNILALNAAVEAARAGQYGKGFAVVAEEVRNLAQKSAAAAKETTAMIESSIDKVKLGTNIANGTEQALKEIVVSVAKSSELVSQIANASNEQASAITQVSNAIEQVSGVVQTNSATAEETASASEELTSQAEMLKSMVNRFKLKDDKDEVSLEILKKIEGLQKNPKEVDIDSLKAQMMKSAEKSQINLGDEF